MTLENCEKLYKELATKFECDFELVWSKRVKRFRTTGKCYGKKKIIKLQPNYVELNSDEMITNTILHEIAHALTPKHGHNKFWKRKAISIGCDGYRFVKGIIIR